MNNENLRAEVTLATEQNAEVALATEPRTEQKTEQKTNLEQRLKWAVQYTIQMGETKVACNWHLLKHHCPLFCGWDGDLPDSPVFVLEVKSPHITEKGLELFIQIMHQRDRNQYLNDENMGDLYGVAVYFQCEWMLKHVERQFDKLLRDHNKMNKNLKTVLQIACRFGRESPRYLDSVLAIFECNCNVNGQDAVCGFITGNLLAPNSPFEQIQRDVRLVASDPNLHMRVKLEDVRNILHCPFGQRWDRAAQCFLKASLGP